MKNALILVVDDEPDIGQLIREILEDEGYDVATAENATQAHELVNRKQPDLILLDIWMPDTDGVSLLNQWLDKRQISCPVVMMSGHGTVETAVEATRLGAFDFLEKPLSMAKLLLTVANALEERNLNQEEIALRKKIKSSIEPIGKSAAISQLKDQTKRLAQHDTRVLLIGEAGSGKQTFARYLHANSPRKDRPFIDVGVGIIAADFSSIEFFGRTDGGTVHQGLLEQANGGTVYLDEVADLDRDTQLKLFSALESGSFVRVGGNEQIRFDVRVIAATQKVLDEEIQARRFRQDLFYLLNEVSLQIPSLREHAEDIPELLSYYVDFFVESEKLPFRKFTLPVQNFLRHYSWPGNVRELKNLVQRILILGSGQEVELAEVKSILGSEIDKSTVEKPDFYDMPLKDAREQFEKAYLEYHLDRSGGSVAKLSNTIGMERTHLYRKLHSLGIKFREKR